jgi:CO/xanthine dehydrogenase FAD-binding subunit
MKDIQWYFPRSLDEIYELLAIPGTIPHGGGTSILKGGVNRVKGLIDLSHLPLNYFRKNGKKVEIGAAQTFADVCENITPGHILTKSLGVAASTPLRNRITLGGSIALFPAWSDLMGPLLALDAEVSLIGSESGTYPVFRYVTESKLRRNSLLTGIRIKTDRWNSFYFRQTRTYFDYPAFTITILMKRDKNMIEDLRAVVVGCAGKFNRLYKVEEAFREKKLDGAEVKGLANIINVRLTPKHSLSADYLQQMVRVQLERGLESLLRG